MMTTPSLDLHIRWMIRRDMETILAIEQAVFPHPWSQCDFIRCLQKQNCIGMVAERDGQVAGYMLYDLHRSIIQLLNFAVAPEHQRHGVGTHMVEKLKGKLSTQRRRRIEAHVWEQNLVAQLFFSAQGFRAVLPIVTAVDITGTFEFHRYRMIYRHKAS
jgi:[ribosomal protein S18]-alanine N-acetyltransferase